MMFVIPYFYDFPICRIDLFKLIWNLFKLLSAELICKNIATKGFFNLKSGGYKGWMAGIKSGWMV